MNLADIENLEDKSIKVLRCAFIAGNLSYMLILGAGTGMMYMR